MNVNWCCGCFGLTASSVRPVKRYNLLVPDVFPRKQPPAGQPLDPGIQRNIQRLREYVDKNAQRGPKVSRRLARHLQKDMRSQRWGYAMLAAKAYQGLLDSSNPATVDLLATELVVQRVSGGSSGCTSDSAVVEVAASASQGSVIGKLLHQKRPELCTAGAELYHRFADLQDTTDYLPQLEALVPHLCRNAAPALQVDAEAGTEADEMAAASLVALNAYHDLAVRLSAPARGFRAAAAALTSCFAAHSSASSPNVGEERAIAAGNAQQPSAAAAAACQFAEEIGRRTKDVLSAEEMLSSLFEAAAAAGLWQQQEAAQLLMAALRRGLDEPHQIYLTFSTLLKFAAARPTQEQQVVLAAAVELATQLTDAFSTAALALLLRTAAQLPAAGAAALGDALPNSARALAQHCGQARTMNAATCLLLGLSAPPSPAALAAVSAAVAAAQPVALEAVRPLLTDAAAILVAEAASPEQRSTTHALLCQLRLAQSLPKADALVLLSACWHQAASPSSTPQQFANIAATFTWILTACDAGGLAAAASFVGALWLAAPSATGPLSAISGSRRAAVMALHCAAGTSLAAHTGGAAASLLPQADDKDAAAVAASLQSASHLRVEGSVLIVTNPADWSVQDDATAAPLLASISAAGVAMPAAPALAHEPKLKAALQAKFGLLPCATLLEKAQGYMITSALTEPAAADNDPPTPRTPVSPAGKVARRSFGPFGGGTPPSIDLQSLGRQRSQLRSAEAAQNEGGAQRRSAEAVPSSAAPAAPVGAPNAKLPPAHGAMASSSADGSTAGNAIAALDALLEAQGVPPMRRQPPPGLFSAA